MADEDFARHRAPQASAPGTRGRPARLRTGVLHALPIVWIAMAATSATAAPKPKLTPEQGRQITALLDKDPTVDATAKLCPADAFNTRKAGSDGSAEAAKACLEHPVECTRNCLAGAAADYCLTLALQTGENEDVIAPVQTMRLFSLACAEGIASGCTNRASMIRNTDTEGEPFKDADRATKKACEHRSFALACDNDNSWGCAMLGQSFANGEGTAKNAAAARRAYQRACTIKRGDGKPYGPACAFAQRGLKDLWKP